VAFKNLAAGNLHAISTYQLAGRYGLRVIAGYQSALPPDAHEDDNSCNAADQRLPYQVVPFRDTLTIENPHDIDWIRFTVANGGQHRFRLHAFTGPRLNLYVIRVPIPGDTVLQIVTADTVGSLDVNQKMGLGPGDYYAVVLDYTGTPTQYEICVAIGDCPTTFPAPSTASSRSP
jgi:hypothetical protein